jgi:multiple sugar transport system permease protein
VTGAPVLFAFGTILTWVGYGFALHAIYLLFKLAAKYPDVVRRLAISSVVAGVALFWGSWITATKGLHIPLVWFIMPFSAWALVVSVVFLIVRSIQAASSLYPDEKQSRLKAAGIWLLAAIAFVFLYRFDPTRKIQIITGAIPISFSVLASLLLLAVGTISVMVASARAARLRGLAKGAITHLALALGSILFGLPLVWLLVTSFKEDVDMSSPTGIVWIPRVSQTVPYFNKEKPRYATRYQGTDVQGLVIESRPDGTVKLDINKPMSMRGMTVVTPRSALTEVPTPAPLVTVQMRGQTVTGKVIDELDDGHKRVEAISPKEFAGRQQIYAPAETTPVRKVGLRTQNYSDALDYLPVEANKGLTYVKNTLIIVVFGLLGTVLSSAIVAYAFSRMRFPGRNVMFYAMLATMMLPGAVTKLPQFMIFKQFGWIDTLYPLWVPAFFGSGFNIFMLRQFFKQIPMELEDAAKIDGAGYLRTFWSVMMPQIKPAIAVIAILTFVGTWNNFLDPLIYINSPENMTISYAVQLYASDRAGEPGLLTAFTMMSMIPVLALFFFAQRYFIEGVTLSGLGGR